MGHRDRREAGGEVSVSAHARRPEWWLGRDSETRRHDHQTVIEERAITAHEAAIVRWLLEHAAMRNVTAYRQVAVEGLRVSGWCDCGCWSLSFKPYKKGMAIIADALARYDDGQQAGLILWGLAG